MINQTTKTPIGTATTQPLRGPWQFAQRDRVAASLIGFAVWGALALLASGVGTGGRTWTLPPGYDEWTFLTTWGSWWMGGVAVLASVYAAFGLRWLRRLADYRKRRNGIAPIAPGDPKDLHTVWIAGLSSVGEMLLWLPLVPLVAAVVSPAARHGDLATGWIFPLMACFIALSGLALMVGLCLCAGAAFRLVGALCHRNAAPPWGDYVAVAAFLLWFAGVFAFARFWNAGFDNYPNHTVATTTATSRPARDVSHFDTFARRP